MTAAVAHPCDESALSAAAEAGRLGILNPILVGPEARIRQVADDHGIDISGFERIDAAHSHQSAARAGEQVRNGRAEVLM